VQNASLVANRPVPVPSPAAAIAGILDGRLGELGKSLAESKHPPLNEQLFNTLKAAQQSCLEKQAAAQMASESLIRAKLATEMARGNEPANLLSVLEDQILSLSMDID